ncbi:hypothetical protein [Carboxylicivirga sp. RSCT41]|uniref:hypothetical protein n=1 Tax=Carboxylicivirga agarovorans TaxID=3417570 RepID=UPI003D33B4EC
MKNLKTTILLSLTLLITACASEKVQAHPSEKQAYKRENWSSEHCPDGIYVRMITLAAPFQTKAKTANWMLPDYTAQDILARIAELKPDCLERFITGKQNPDQLVPVAKGEEPMTVLEFLNKAIAAGSPECIIIPKLNLKWGEEYFWEAAQNLYNLPLDKPIRNINLDCWPDYWKEHTTEETEAMLKRLKDIGYEVIGINMTGGYHPGYGYVDYMDFNINKEDWTVNTKTLNRLKKDKELKRFYMYIDYPGAMDQFRKENSVDEQAHIYIHNIHPFQEEMGFTFVYAIFQDDWDATQEFTSANGPYGGKSMFDITRQLIEESRKQE